MAKKDVFTVVSGMGLATSIITNLTNAVSRKGGTDEDIHRLADPEKSRETWNQIADSIIQSSSAIQATFQVVVNCGQSLNEMISAGKYNWVNENITPEHFPIIGQGKQKVEVTLFHFNRVISSKEVIREMDKAGYRPAKIEELLALGESQPELQKQFPIVALDSLWRDPGGLRRVPCLDWGGGERGLSLYWFGRGWIESCRFVAVRK